MIDLHMHTIYSDGTDSVEELLKKANALNLDIISITDHDSCDAYYELENILLDIWLSYVTSYVINIIHKDIISPTLEYNDYVI